MNLQQAVALLERRIIEIEQAIDPNLGWPSDFVEGTRMVKGLAEMVHRLSPPGSTYPAQASTLLERSAHAIRNTKPMIAIARALHKDYTDGLILSVASLVRADVFGDFLQMAEHLLSENYKDASAVMIGAVLEDHLRRLADLNQIASTVLAPGGRAKPKTASLLNNDLRGAAVYNLVQHSVVESWIRIRNAAAHGNYGEYTGAQVQSMLDGVRLFILSYPA